MLNSVRKRKEKHTIDKEIQDQMKEIKALLIEGKIQFEKSETESDFMSTLTIFSKGISKLASTHLSNAYLLLYYRGLCYFKLRQFEKAERDFLQGIGLADQKSKVQLYNALGKCKIEMSDKDPTYLEDAIKCFEKAIDYSLNSDGESYLNLASIYRKIKNYFQAIKEATNAIKNLKYPQQFEAYIQRGICSRQIGENQNSIEDFQKACELNKDNAEAHFQLGVSYLLLQKYSQGLEQLATAIEIDSSEPKYHNYKGLALYLSGQFDVCLGVFKETLRIYEMKGIKNQQVGQCWFNLGSCLFFLGKLEEALKALQTAQKYNLDSMVQLKIYYTEGLVFEELKKSEAIVKYRKTLELLSDPSHDLYLSSKYHLAYNLYSQKQNEKALEVLMDLINSENNDKCIYELRGKVYLELEIYNKALKDFEVVASIEPDYPDIYYYLGICKSNLKEIDEAIADFFKALQLGSRNVAIFNGISSAYLRAQKQEKALVYANFALQKEPNNENFLIQRSMILLELGEKSKGIQDLTKALQMNSVNPVIFYKRGMSYYQNKQFPQAINDLQKALQLKPSKKIESDIHYFIGISQANLQKFQKAIHPLTNAINLQPTPKFFHERAKCYLLQEKNREALYDLNKVLEQQPNNAYAFFRRGLANKALKKYEQAAEDFIKARELDPDNPKLIINKKQIYDVKYRKLCAAGQQE